MNSISEVSRLFRLSHYGIEKYSLQGIFKQKLPEKISDRMIWFHSIAKQINAQRASNSEGAPPVVAGRLNALLLLSEAYTRVICNYNQKYMGDLLGKTISEAEKRSGKSIHNAMNEFLKAFQCPENCIGDEAETTQSMLITWLNQNNPAAEIYSDLFNTDRTDISDSINNYILNIKEIWSNYPHFKESDLSLFELLLKPFSEQPESIEAQLRYIAENWKSELGDFSIDLLKGADTIREETRPVFGGPGPAHVIEYTESEYEPEAFSPDIDWMPDVVLLAKNVYVWLEQLTRQYGVKIEKLDDIPDEELRRISKQGFTGLWLIGLWERSQASRQIKQICGNPEAAASAYSLADYRIAEDLGGDESYDRFQERAKIQGIRIAGDMVPNHMGIDSWWLCQHPDWFISTETVPFAHYTFTGIDLSPDQRCSIYLEDHYYDKTDAAVVFKYVDNWNGRIRYVYHGNDGTDLPWNDTAQLNFIREDVREQVIQTILKVAKRFPIIRFDAAMTLAKKHFHRLWFPEPGQGGDIPSRSWVGISKEDFDKLMPAEFWREVVERVSKEAPDTLLLAEAFWLMEGYFVRSLGMHRVYNSAFMNMLRTEDNQNFRLVIKNTIEFDPEILKRYVNFMNNPDEDPAVVQFGKGDKYFGVCAMMSTLPGLPMFGHGQFEGFEEKYGMEYRRSYWNEEPDEGLVAHHNRVISPILRKRRVFSGVENFRLYDFYLENNQIDETEKHQEVLVYLHHGWIKPKPAVD